MGFKGSKLRALRRERGLSKEQFAAQLFSFETGGMTRVPTTQQVTGWEWGRYAPRFPTALRIARFFGVAAEELAAPDEAEVDE